MLLALLFLKVYMCIKQSSEKKKKKTFVMSQRAQIPSLGKLQGLS